MPGVAWLTPQRAWAREQFGVALPGVTRSDEPSFRRIETWRIAIAACYQTWRIAIAACYHPTLQP